MRFCISLTDEFDEFECALFLLRVSGAAYEHEDRSPLLIQLSHGCDLLHLSFLFRHGAHDKGILFRFLTTLYCPSGECCEVLDDPADGGVGVIVLD